MIDPNNECLEQFLIIFYEIFDRWRQLGGYGIATLSISIGKLDRILLLDMASVFFYVVDSEIYERGYIMEVNRVPFIKMNRLYIHCEPGFKGPGKPQDIYIINASLLSPTLPFLMILRL